MYLFLHLNFRQTFYSIHRISEPIVIEQKKKKKNVHKTLLLALSS